MDEDVEAYEQIEARDARRVRGDETVVIEGEGDIVETTPVNFSNARRRARWARIFVGSVGSVERSYGMEAEDV